MSIKKVSVTKTSSFTVDGEGRVSRERIVDLSHDWSEKDIILFKKIAKQGGVCRIKGNKYTVVPGEKITNSQFQPDGGADKMHGPEE